jgi:hypothetical protein
MVRGATNSMFVSVAAILMASAFCCFVSNKKNDVLPEAFLFLCSFFTLHTFFERIQGGWFLLFFRFNI